MATDTSKITTAADDLGDKLTKGGAAAKTLGTEIASAFGSLDARVAALEAGSVTPPDPIPPDPVPPDTSTAGKVTNFTSTPKQNFSVGGINYQVQTAGRSYSLGNPDQYTLRYEVHRGDYAWYDSGSVDRSEIEGSPRYGNDKLITITFKLMLGANSGSAFSNTADSYFIIGQLHNADVDPYWTSPPLYLHLVGDKLAVDILWCPTGQDATNSAGNLKHLYPFKDTKSLAAGTWHDVKIQAKFQNNANGVCDVWLNGTQVVNYRGPIGFGTPVYWEYGIYRNAAPENCVVSYKNMSISQ